MACRPGRSDFPVAGGGRRACEADAARPATGKDLASAQASSLALLARQGGGVAVSLRTRNISTKAGLAAIAAAPGSSAGAIPALPRWPASRTHRLGYALAPPRDRHISGNN